MKNLIMKNYGLIAFAKFEEIYGLLYKNVIFDLAKNNNSVTTKHTKC